MSVEATMSYDLLPGADEQGYWELIKAHVPVLLRAEGIEELRAHRSLLGSPGVRITMVWDSVRSFAAFMEGSRGQAVLNELRAYATQPRIEVWAPSPYLPEPVHALPSAR